MQFGSGYGYGTDKMLVKNRDLESIIKNSDPIFEKNTNLESDTGPDHDISLDVSKYTFLFKKKLWLLLSSWFQIRTLEESRSNRIQNTSMKGNFSYNRLLCLPS